MKTLLKTAHEEQYSDGSKTLGVLFNYSFEVENDGWYESFIYIFNHEKTMYIFFNTMFDMWSYILYGEDKMKRAYMDEEEFDSYYDAPQIDGKFSDLLKWV
jgi:hypothetical protein